MKISGLAALFGLVGAMALSLPSHASHRIVNLEVSDVRPGAIVIKQNQFKLYYVLSRGKAMEYPIASPKPGAEWYGSRSVQSKHWKPAWAPPSVVLAANPNVSSQGAGSDRNPMGVAAIMLGDEIAIHGTAAHMRSSIGKKKSFGCIRMLNEDITDLFQRVNVGTPVISLR